MAKRSVYRFANASRLGVSRRDGVNKPSSRYLTDRRGLAPRYEGAWGSAGNRQTEVSQGTPRDYYLWTWKNPRDGAEIASIEIQPQERRFIVAAVTLGYLDENPIPRRPRREVKITLPQADDADKPFDMEVNVDREALRPTRIRCRKMHPMPFINDDFKGWGESQNNKSSPAYAEVSATPSATVEVKNQGETLGSVNWGEVEEKGTVQPNERVKVEVIDSGRNWVHTTVIDEDTNRPVPCRIHFRSPHGVPYAPHGHHAHVNSNNGTWHIDVGGDVRLGQISYAYIDGTCQGWLPRGDVIVDVARGFEYTPLRTTVNIKPGQRELTLRLKRWCDMNAERYFSGDTHVHFLSTQGAHTEAQGEDLGVVNLAPFTVGTSLHEYRGVYRKTHDLCRWTEHRLCDAGESATRPRSLDALRFKGTGCPVVF